MAIDVSGHKVLVSGKEVNLTASEFKLLTTLSRYPGRVYSRMELVEKVLGYDFEGYERTIDSHIFLPIARMPGYKSSPCDKTRFARKIDLSFEGFCDKCVYARKIDLGMRDSGSGESKLRCGAFASNLIKQASELVKQ